ncbi:MAG: sialidase family protein, partial [Gemmatimonadaceae bacterium]
QSPLPRAPGAHVVTISGDKRASEPGIAMNFRNPGQIVGVFGGPWAAYSTDSGRTFTLADGTQPAGWNGAGDVSVAFDDKGSAFLSYLTIDKLGSSSYWAHGATRNGVWVRRSPDGGKTWDKEPVPVKVWPTGKEPGLQFEDMPRIWSDVSPKSPHRGNLYMGWIEWQLTQSIMLFSRSTDGGKSWSPPARISTKAGLPRDDNGGLVGIIGVVGTDGAMYVIWNDASSIVFTSSRDGGKTFDPSRSVIPVGPPYFGGAGGGVPGVSRVMGFPQIGIDPRTGTLFATWSDYRNGDIDVFISRSADKGRTWTPAMRVNSDPIHNGNDQFFQWLAVDPLTRDVYVQFYDRRDDPANRQTSVSLARSTDGGKTFANYAWSDEPFAGEAPFLGDYMWLTAYDGRVYGIWAEAAPLPASATPAERRSSPTLMKVGTADFRHDRGDGGRKKP